MALIESDRVKDSIPLSMLRGALIDEISATDLYDRLASSLPEYEDIFNEIKKDEINHQGRLLNLILRIDEEQAKPFQKGLKQEE